MSQDMVYRTSPARTAKMMAIMLGICLAGGVIFFALWDYWISEPAPIVAILAGDEGQELVEVELTGTEIPVSLSFIESEDFRTLAFNALPGDPDNNPTIEANVGDKIIFDVVNDGISFHAFGVTAAESGATGIFPGSEIGLPNDSLSSGESGQSEFVPPEEGIYYYICTVAGHRIQGMVGTILVGDVEAPEIVETEPEPAAAEIPAAEPVELTGSISTTSGSSLPGCEQDNTCYIPANALVSVGDTVTWSNDDTAAHTVTSRLPADDDKRFDSGLFAAGAEYSVTFDEAGEYPYFCLVHPHMTGIVTVR